MSAEIRAWAAANGYSVGVRGRIPDAVSEAYQAATAGIPDSPSDLTPEIIERARRERCAVCTVGGEIRLYRTARPPEGSILLDFR